MFKNLYKENFSKCERQETRRKLLLQEQKLKRAEQQDANRPKEAPHHYRSKQKPCHMEYNNIMNDIQVQYAEWLKEKPENLDDWILVPYPKGQRCLVIAEKGRTIMFSKTKKYIMSFSSCLPGGGLSGSSKYRILLDCVFNKEKDTFYVLDALHYFIPLIDCGAEFRFFWLKSRFNELERFENKYEFKDVKNFEFLDNCDMANEDRLAMTLQNYPLWSNNQPQLDGFLFYHKKSQYVYGTTPLVGWLFPFMLPDVLQMPVCSSYKSPDNYCNHNPWQYMDEFDEMLKIRSKNIHNKRELDLNNLDFAEGGEECSDGNSDNENDMEYYSTAEKFLEEEMY